VQGSRRSSHQVRTLGLARASQIPTCVIAAH
jgi:hypothetical protein